MGFNCRFNDFLFLRGLQQIALHGIELPAGITEWDPMVSKAERFDFGYGIGFRLDVRRSAPVPAANRLFVDPLEGGRLAVPVLRALSRFALETSRQRSTDVDWNEWAEISMNVRSRGYLKDVYRAERRALERELRLEIVTEDGLTTQMTIDEARVEFGRWLPLARGDGQTGLRPTLSGKLLLFGHPRRRNDDDKRVAVDLDVVDESIDNLF